MLAQILPGFRDFRTPLVAGYLWLIGAWILLGMPVPSSETKTGLVGIVNGIGSYLSPTVSLVVLSFAAFFVGMLASPDMVATMWFWNRRFMKTRKKVAEHFRKPTASKKKFTKLRHSLSQLDRLDHPGMNLDLTDSILRLCLDNLDEAKRKNVSWVPIIEYYMIPEKFQTGDWKDFFNRLAEELAGSLEDEIRNLSAPLQAANEKLYNEYDRSRSEANFRINIILPINFVALSIAWSLWQTHFWLAIAAMVVAVIVSMRLYQQARRKLIDASEVAFAAVRESLVKPKSLERVRSLDKVPSDSRD